MPNISLFRESLMFASILYIKFMDSLFEHAYGQVLNNYRSTPEQRYRQLLARYPRLFDRVSLGEIASYLNISCLQPHRFREGIIAAKTPGREKIDSLKPRKAILSESCAICHSFCYF